jgi:hypothetical protein
MQKEVKILMGLIISSYMLSSCAGYSVFYGSEKMCTSVSPSNVSVKMLTKSSGYDSKLMLELTDAKGIKHRFFDYDDREPESCSVQTLEGNKRLFIRVEDRLTRALEVTYDSDAKLFAVR